MNNQNPPTIIENIPLVLNEEELLRHLQMDAGSVFIQDIRWTVHEAEALARPKGLYRLSAVEHTGETTVTLDGITFTSRVLRINLDSMYRAFSFLATCGQELEAWSRTLQDPMQQFWADTIKEMALRQAIQALSEQIRNTYETSDLAMMNPGSLPDWPISEQRPLFALFGDAAGAIGVQLKESGLMSPVKTVSGVWLSTEKGFVNCQLCKREDCPNRRMPFDQHVLDLHYQ